MQPNEVRALIVAALADLARAVEALQEQTVPVTPLPRPRQFEIVPGVVWPSSSLGWDYADVSLPAGKTSFWISTGHYRKELAEMIIRATGAQPRRLLRALRRIEAATAWCRARRAGRERMAQEILRQQARAVEQLEAELVWRSLR